MLMAVTRSRISSSDFGFGDYVSSMLFHCVLVSSLSSKCNSSYENVSMCLLNPALSQLIAALSGNSPRFTRNRFPKISVLLRRPGSTSNIAPILRRTVETRSHEERGISASVKRVVIAKHPVPEAMLPAPIAAAVVPSTPMYFVRSERSARYGGSEMRGA